jgi:nucleotide-binding universal stress UspA family protein
MRQAQSDESSKEGAMKPILLATDGSPTAEKAAATAFEYAKAFGARLVIASVWDVSYEPIGIAYGPVIPDLDHVGHTEAERLVAAAAEQAQGEGLDVETVTRRGTPVQQICAIADDYDPQLIVLGSRGWGPVRRMLFGSVSTGVLHHANQPVLVVRGDDVADTPAELHDVEATV